MRAASTMNQSDIRGLFIKNRANIDILRRELVPSKVASSVRQRRTYHIGETPSAPIVPAPFSVTLYTFSTIKEQLRWRADEKNLLIHQAARFTFFLAWYSLNTDHINPASSRAIATVTLHGILPQLVRCL